ncbi:MAG TPA: glycosyltransferase family 4 protein [Candidatus Paceibacterota bacterium]|nr:glycosyltransferase family 4 protein [Candidatus Paceibacterota bacterium]
MTTEVAEKRRILYIVTLARWGGAQRYVHDLAQAAQAAGHTVAVLSQEGELTERLRAAGITTYIVSDFQRNIGLWSEIRALKKIFAALADFKPDVIHVNSSKAAGLGGFAARTLGVRRIVFTAHGWAFNEMRPWWQRGLIWLAHYATVLLTDNTICVSRAIRENGRSMPLVQNRFTVIHHGVEEGVCLSQDEARFLLAPHISFPTWIGTIAELHPNKQLDTLIEAFANLADHYPNTTLMIIGGGNERVYLEELIRMHGLEARVRLRGHVENASAYLRALDMFVLPSRTEALGYVLLEAGLAGLPVVASNVGGIPEIIEDGRTGMLVPSGDVNALEEALRAYLENTELGERMAGALKEHVRMHFSKERMMRDTFALY